MKECYVLLIACFILYQALPEKTSSSLFHFVHFMGKIAGLESACTLRRDYVIFINKLNLLK